MGMVSLVTSYRLYCVYDCTSVCRSSAVGMIYGENIKKWCNFSPSRVYIFFLTKYFKVKDASFFTYE